MSRTGEPAYQTVFGLPFFEDLNAHPDIQASFDTLMGPEGHGVPSAEFQLADGWESVRACGGCRRRERRDACGDIAQMAWYSGDAG